MPLPNNKTAPTNLDRRSAMLGKLNPVYRSAYIDYPEYYKQNHGIVQESVANIAKAYPEEFRNLMDENLHAYETSLNRIDFMDSSKATENNPVARLGSQDANITLRIPPAWADSLPLLDPTDPTKGSIAGFHSSDGTTQTPPINVDRLVIPMQSALGKDRATAADVIDHEVTHRGFDNLGVLADDITEHNYVYSKTAEAHPDSSPFATQADIDKAYPLMHGAKPASPAKQASFNLSMGSRIDRAANAKLNALAKPPSNFIPSQSLGSID